MRVARRTSHAGSRTPAAGLAHKLNLLQIRTYDCERGSAQAKCSTAT